VNVVDSSAWLEYFADGANASFFSGAIENTRELLVPALSLYEVYKRVLQQRGETAALHAVAVMQQGRVLPIDAVLAIRGARLSVELGLPMADSLMLATARANDAEFWTQDADFASVPGVRYRATGGRSRR
jgi:predicted nucleic acid-binding protein